MSVQKVSVHPGSYVDSLVLMTATVGMEKAPGVSWAGAYMATAKAREDLVADGFAAGDLDGLGANDLVLAVKADSVEAVDAALEAGRGAAFAHDEVVSRQSADRTVVLVRDDDIERHVLNRRPKHLARADGRAGRGHGGRQAEGYAVAVNHPGKE